MAVTTQEKDILTNVKNVAGVLRISTEKTDSMGKKVNIQKTLLNHKEKMLDVMNEKKWTYTLYEEVISGGTDLEDRPELQRMISDIDQYDAIVCMELTRLSRQGLTSQTIKHLVKKKGILIITLNPFKVYDMRNPQDVFMFDLSISMGEYEKGVVSLRVKQNKISMAHQGLNSSGSVPFGYVRNPETKKLEIEKVKDEHGKNVESPKAKIVRMIYQWYLDGEGQRTICDKLNAMGILNNKGNTWVPNSIRYLLSCPTYKGTLIANNYENEKGKMIATETVEKHGNHPAIIDPEIWNKAQQLRTNKKERSGIDKRSKDWNSKKHMSILDRLIFCGCKSCGRKSTIKWYEARQNFYIIKCTRFNTDGKTCTNGGNNIKDVEQLVFKDLLLYKEQVEQKINAFSSDDFEIRFTELEDQKKIYEYSLKDLEFEMNAIGKMEMKYEIEKQMKQKEDKAKEQMIEEMKQENDEKRMHLEMKLAEIYKKLDETPSADEEIKRLNERLDIIKELQTNKDLDKHQVNTMLKMIILKVNYKRELPNNYKSLSKIEKEQYEAIVEVEYIK